MQKSTVEQTMKRIEKSASIRSLSRGTFLNSLVSIRPNKNAMKGGSTFEIDAASLLYKNRAKITVLLCEQKLYAV